MVKQSLSCFRESMSDLSNTYTTALLAYIFTLVGDMEVRAHLLKHLDTVALRQGESSSLRHRYCKFSSPCVFFQFVGGFPPLVSDSNRNVSFSVCGDQLLCAVGQTQCLSYCWRPGLLQHRLSGGSQGSRTTMEASPLHRYRLNRVMLNSELKISYVRCLH